MPHTRNQRAFRDCDAGATFFRLYTMLVAIELALKDLVNPFVSGHNLTTLAGFAVVPMTPGLTPQLTALNATLSRLTVTSKNGLPVPLNAANYPELRYLRHAQDFPAGGTTDADVDRALNDARQLIEELRLAGVAL